MTCLNLVRSKSEPEPDVLTLLSTVLAQEDEQGTVTPFSGDETEVQRGNGTCSLTSMVTAWSALPSSFLHSKDHLQTLLL